MSAKSRVTRRDLLKKPDEFIVFTQRIINLFEKNRKAVLGVVGVLAISLVLFGIFHFWRVSNRQQALLLEQEGNILFTARRTKGVYGMEEVKPVGEVRKALEKYKEIIQSYSGTQSAERALVYIGDCYLRLNQLDDAEKNYLKYLEKHPDRGFLTIPVKQSLGYVYEAKRDYDKAIRYYLAASGNFPEEERLWSFMDVARCYEEMGNFHFATEYYQKVVRNVESDKDSRNIQFRGNRYDIDRIKVKISQLQSRP
jgi:tetratricopeptide (TPR) repeat protein